ncbi:MAG: hypothetical protein N4A59_10475 [Marinifilum sp.]|nr:hypothetical protein [Marinifilum sp.]
MNPHHGIITLHRGIIIPQNFKTIGLKILNPTVCTLQIYRNELSLITNQELLVLVLKK